MTDPQTPATEAGRRHVDVFATALASRPNAGGLTWEECVQRATDTVIAIEAEARAGYVTEDNCAASQAKACAIAERDALREAADAVRALPRRRNAVSVDLAAVLAILDPEPKP